MAPMLALTGNVQWHGEQHPWNTTVQLHKTPTH